MKLLHSYFILLDRKIEYYISYFHLKNANLCIFYVCIYTNINIHLNYKFSS